MVHIFAGVVVTVLFIITKYWDLFLNGINSLLTYVWGLESKKLSHPNKGIVRAGSILQFGKDCNKIEPVIVFYQGKKYDITKFLCCHPGGRTILHKYSGKDVEEIMKKHKHSQRAYDILKEYEISE